ncbi:MAG: hypothetical protein QOD77_1107, partial [Thermoplasmata archaeon]|nr:hypothetical protein [Thermoplasmata archaeon]
EASLLAALTTTEALQTKDIVAKTGLRQPEVSTGMHLLRDRGWIEEGTHPRKGKGRPMHVYRLSVPLRTIRKHYEEQGRRTLAEYQEALQVLKERLK